MPPGASASVITSTTLMNIAVSGTVSANSTTHPKHKEQGTMNNKELIHEAYRKALAADDVWSRNLQAKFGKQAGDKRYTSEAHSVKGYAEFMATTEEWRRLVKIS
jgi:hypothetical protein